MRQLLTITNTETNKA